MVLTLSRSFICLRLLGELTELGYGKRKLRLQRDCLTKELEEGTPNVAYL